MQYIFLIGSCKLSVIVCQAASYKQRLVGKIEIYPKDSEAIFGRTMGSLA